MAVVIVVMLTGLDSPASATSGAQTDPTGDAGGAAIDIKRVTHDDTASEIIYTLEAAAAFTNTVLGATEVDWDASAAGLEVKVGENPGVYCVTDAGSIKVGDVTVTRKPTGSAGSTAENSLEATYPRSLLGRCGLNGLTYQYAVFVNDPAVTGVVDDAAPDGAPGNKITHTLSAVASADGRLPAVARDSTWFLKNALTTGVADASFVYGNPGDVPLMCDWDGNGSKTPGVRRGITFYLRNLNSSGIADVAIAFGDPGDVPVCGDWDGDGDETIGVVRGNQWFLFNRSDPGFDPTSPVFTYGNPGDVPVVGDWDGDSDDTPGVKRGIRFYLRNTASGGPANVDPFDFGNPGDVPVIADWDGNGTETVGLFRLGSWFFRNANTTGPAETPFGFGQAGDRGLTR